MGSVASTKFIRVDSDWYWIYSIVKSRNSNNEAYIGIRRIYKGTISFNSFNRLRLRKRQRSSPSNINGQSMRLSWLSVDRTESVRYPLFPAPADLRGAMKTTTAAAAAAMRLTPMLRYRLRINISVTRCFSARCIKDERKRNEEDEWIYFVLSVGELKRLVQLQRRRDSESPSDKGTLRSRDGSSTGTTPSSYSRLGLPSISKSRN